MGSNVFSNTGEAGIFFDDALDTARSKAAVVAVLARLAGIFGVIKEEGGEGIVASREIISDAAGGGFVDKNRAVFATFTADDEFATI